MKKARGERQEKEGSKGVTENNSSCLHLMSQFLSASFGAGLWTAHTLSCATLGQGNLIAQCLSFLIPKVAKLVLHP